MTGLQWRYKKRLECLTSDISIRPSLFLSNFCMNSFIFSLNVGFEGSWKTKYLFSIEVKPEWSCVPVLNLRSLNSPRLLLSGPSPTPWRSSPAPFPRCSHYLEDRQNIATCYRNIPRTALFSVLLACRNPISVDVVIVSNGSQHGSVFSPRIDSNMSLLPVTLFLPPPPAQ